MELYEVASIESIKVGDVVVANYPGYAYTAVINRISSPTDTQEGDEDVTSWVFSCGTASKMVRHDDDTVTIQDKSDMEFMFNPNTDELPQSVFVVR